MPNVDFTRMKAFSFILVFSEWPLLTGLPPKGFLVNGSLAPDAICCVISILLAHLVGYVESGQRYLYAEAYFRPW